jgi:uncharacterized protein (TIGR00266 family)
MAQFTLTDGQDPFLHVHLNKNEIIYSESNSMVMMDATLDLEGKMQGGFFNSLMRRTANDNSFFRQQIKAVRGDGDVLLSQRLPGSLHILNVDNNNTYNLNDGVFLACEEHVDTTVKSQGIGNSLFGSTGGFFITRASGHGKLVVGGFGDIFEIEVQPGNDIIIDNNHVVAWDEKLNYNISISTSKGKGFFGNLLNSQLSGEAMVTRFSGKGKVYICSRNKLDFAAWVSSLIIKEKR